MKAITLSPQDFAVFTSDKLVEVLQVIEHSTKELVTIIFNRAKPRTQKTTEFEISLEVHQSFEVKLPRSCRTEDAAHEVAKLIPESVGCEAPDGADGGDLSSHIYDVVERQGRWVALVSCIYSTALFHECGTLRQAKAYANAIAKQVKITVQPDFGSEKVNFDCKVKALKCIRSVLVE